MSSEFYFPSGQSIPHGLIFWSECEVPPAPRLHIFKKIRTSQIILNFITV